MRQSARGGGGGARGSKREGRAQKGPSVCSRTGLPPGGAWKAPFRREVSCAETAGGSGGEQCASEQQGARQKVGRDGEEKQGEGTNGASPGAARSAVS